MGELYVVDGTFELFRCLRAAPRAQVDGREVGAVRGLVQTLISLLKTPGLTHVAVAFDPMPRPRAGETGDGATLRAQSGLAADAVRALGVSLWPMVRFQADDGLATAAARWGDDPALDRVVLCTADLDLWQCVRGDRVVVWDRIRDRIVDEAAVRHRFGVPPRRLPEWFALVGDASDGITGLPGWGPKAATGVLDAFPSLEAVPDDPGAWPAVRGAERLARVLAERRDEVRLYRNLCVRHDGLDLPHRLEDLAWRAPPWERLEAFVAALADAELVARVGRWRAAGPASR